jgi:hypothetical protein
LVIESPKCGLTDVDTRQFELPAPDAQSEPATTTVFGRLVVPVDQPSMSSRIVNENVALLPAENVRLSQWTVLPDSAPLFVAPTNEA